MKPIISVTLAVLSAAATMAHAKVDINVASQKASEEHKAATKELLNRHELSRIMDYNIESLAVAMKLDEKPLKLDVSAMLAAANGVDSTYRSTYSPIAADCYGNCYTNCHGSRSWR